MHRNTRGAGLLLRIFLAGVLAVCAGSLAAAETNATTNADLEGRREEAVVIGTQESLRSSLQIQEELHNLEATIQKDRKDAETATARQAEILEARLKLIEAANNEQQFKELEKLQYDNRMVLFGAGAFAVVGFVVLLFAALGPVDGGDADYDVDRPSAARAGSGKYAGGAGNGKHGIAGRPIGGGIDHTISGRH